MTNIRKIALSIRCRRKGCNAPIGVTCGYWKSDEYSPSPSRERLHRVRYNDARRILEAQLKIEDWKQRYGGKQ